MDTLQEIEVSLKAAKETVKLGEALLRLEKNRDFNKLIGERYFQEEASRLVGLLADPEIVGTATEGAIIRDMHAISALRYFFMGIKQSAVMAEKAIEDDEETLRELEEQE